MLNRSGGEAVKAVVVVLRVDATTVEVQVPTVRGGVERRRPVVSVRAAVVPRRAIAVAAAREENCRLFPCTTVRRGCPMQDHRESYVFPAPLLAQDEQPM